MAHLMSPRGDELADEAAVQAPAGDDLSEPALPVSRRSSSVNGSHLRHTGRRIACIGGAALYRRYTGAAPIRFGVSNPVCCALSFGGFARNVAEHLALLGLPVSLASVVGEDATGRELIRRLQALDIETAAIRRSATAATAEYLEITGPDGEMVLALADMGLVDTISLADLDRWWPQLSTAAWVFADCNLAAPTLAACAARRRDGAFRLAVDAVSVPKAMRLPQDMRDIDLLTIDELAAEGLLAARCGVFDLSPGETASMLRSLGAETVVLNLGERGLVLACATLNAAVPLEAEGVAEFPREPEALVAGILCRLVEGDEMLAAARFAARYATHAPRVTRAAYQVRAPAGLAAAPCDPVLEA